MTDRQIPGLTRRGLLSAGGLGLAGLLAGCREAGDEGSTSTPAPNRTPAATSSPTATTTDVEMHTSYFGGNGKWLWQVALADPFEAETGIGVSFEWQLPPNTLRQRLETDDPPDVYTSQFREVVAFWERALAQPDRHPDLSVAFEPATAILNAVGDASGELVVEPYSADGEYWQVPHGYQASTFTYRTDVYEQLGLEVPTSLQGVLENARAIDESDLDVRGYGLPARQVGKAGHEFSAYLARMGTSPVGLRWRDPAERADLEVHFPEAEVTALLEFFEAIADYAPDPTDLDWSESVKRWIDGQFAQQLHLNAMPAGAATRAGAESEDAARIAENTAVAPVPYWEAGGVGPSDSWAYAPRLEGHTILQTGPNTNGAKRWLEWLYAEQVERTAKVYSATPTKYLPAFDGIRQSPSYRSQELFESVPSVLDQVDFVRETVVADHYGHVEEANLADPVALHVARLFPYGELVNRVVTGSNSVQEAYDWGRGELERQLADVRSYMV